MRPFRVLCTLALVAALLGWSGCGNRVTYPKATLTPSLESLLKAEGLETVVRFIDHTLAIQLAAPDLLAQAAGQIGMGPAFDDVMHKLLGTLHRVLLSSDADVRFYVLLLSDPNIPGAYLTMVRYMDDVRRANFQMLDTPEIFARTILELNFVGTETLTIDQYVPRDITLEEFLSWQLARRLQAQLTEELQQQGIATVGRCGGRFENGEFVFTLDVQPPLNAPLDETTIQQVFLSSSKLIAAVLSSYQFKNFNHVRLIHPLTGRDLVLPKTNLEVFR